MKTFCRSVVLIAVSLIFQYPLWANKPSVPIEIVVALDGSGQFKSVQYAIRSVPAGSASVPVVIRIKPGIYKEFIYMHRSVPIRW